MKYDFAVQSREFRAPAPNLKVLAVERLKADWAVSLSGGDQAAYPVCEFRSHSRRSGEGGARFFAIVAPACPPIREHMGFTAILPAAQAGSEFWPNRNVTSGGYRVHQIEVDRLIAFDP
jgi:hypothetical protein